MNPILLIVLLIAGTCFLMNIIYIINYDPDNDDGYYDYKDYDLDNYDPDNYDDPDN